MVNAPFNMMAFVLFLTLSVLTERARGYTKVFQVDVQGILSIVQLVVI